MNNSTTTRARRAATRIRLEAVGADGEIVRACQTNEIERHIADIIAAEFQDAAEYRRGMLDAAAIGFKAAKAACDSANGYSSLQVASQVAASIRNVTQNDPSDAAQTPQPPLDECLAAPETGDGVAGLAPCPFCGAHAKLVYHGVGVDPAFDSDPYGVISCSEGRFRCCPELQFESSKENEANAITEWNTRTTAQPSSAVNSGDSDGTVERVLQHDPDIADALNAYISESAESSSQGEAQDVPERIWLSPIRTSNGYFVTVASDDLGAVEYVRVDARSSLVSRAEVLAAVSALNVGYRSAPKSEIIAAIESLPAKNTGQNGSRGMKTKTSRYQT